MLIYTEQKQTLKIHINEHKDVYRKIKLKR